MYGLPRNPGQNVRTVTATGSVRKTDDVVLLDATNGAFNFTLLSPAGMERQVTLKAINTNSNLITVLAPGTAQIDTYGGSVNLGALGSAAQLNAATLANDNSNYWLV
jgi:hypothetical protein